MARQFQIFKTCNPTPFSGWNYQATYGEPDLGCVVGMGATPDEALLDLIDALESKGVMFEIEVEAKCVTH